MPARLDTRPVASGYRGGIRTRLNNAAFPSRNRVLSSDLHRQQQQPANEYRCVDTHDREVRWLVLDELRGNPGHEPRQYSE
jgi:hypothetical protein